ncbi:hypothetical protein K1719_005968 [Acacia pycnantha]|nr:hypothetical protein K1719_005968 [Acacia pycnantha]
MCSCLLSESKGVRSSSLLGKVRTIPQVNGGREGRPIGAYELAKAVEELGVGEIVLNCIDCDGQGKGFDIYFVKLISDAVSIPVIASSGAGSSAVDHFNFLKCLPKPMHLLRLLLAFFIEKR